MCTFDSPVAPCEVMRTMVVTDQTQRQCAAEHDCAPGTHCPLCGYFTGFEWIEAPQKEGEGPPHGRRT
jgi:hypothetical protein